MKINAERVKMLRTARHWSQEQLADACGLNLRTVQRLERSGNASIESVRALAAVFGVAPDELILPATDERTAPFEAVKTAFTRFADFSGTATRAEYWWFLLFVLIAAAIATVIHVKAYQVVMLILLVPLLAAGTRRLNDVGHSGWWQLLFLVPFGFVPVFVMLAMEGRTTGDAEGARSGT